MNYSQRKEQVRSFLGKMTDIMIDRPIGYVHKKEKYTLEYPINYGYIPGVIGGDGEELDVYLLGVDTPLKEFRARIIGIVHRENDVEDKLIAAPDGAVFDQSEIAAAVDFQEKYYITSVEALDQTSCGAVVYRRSEKGTEVLVVFQDKNGIWSLPKGHREKGETEAQTALREISEETGLRVKLKDGFRKEVRYTFSIGIRKKVVFFLAEYEGGELKADPEEISDIRWVDIPTAKTMLFENCHKILDEAEAYLMG